MLTRRSLFARLSAIALAPLVKWLPKEEAAIRRTDIVGWRNGTFAMDQSTCVPRGEHLFRHNGDMWLLSRDGPKKLRWDGLQYTVHPSPRRKRDAPVEME